MKRQRRSFVLGLVGAVVLSAGMLGCGGGGKKAASADVKPGNMPEGGEWTGVYFSQLYGYLHLVQEGTTLSGKWQRPAKNKWGEVHGSVKGNVARFEWSEYTVGAIGPNSSKSGKGYFRYTRPEGDNVDDVLIGEIGRGEDEVGMPWDAIKQRNMNPDLGSIGGTGASDIGGGDWDNPNTEEGGGGDMGDDEEDIEAPEEPPEPI